MRGYRVRLRNSRRGQPTARGVKSRALQNVRKVWERPICIRIDPWTRSSETSVNATARRSPAKTVVHLVHNGAESVSGSTSRDVPQCLFPLQSIEAQKEYSTLAQLLFRADRLTIDAHRTLSEYTAQFDSLHLSLARGLMIRPSRFDQLKRARKTLKLRDLEEPAPAPEEPPLNKFARCGFANRRR
jgi:hypothetical protein